jgi:hypothetical protein
MNRTIALQVSIQPVSLGAIAYLHRRCTSSPGGIDPPDPLFPIGYPGVNPVLQSRQSAAR